jgi:transaldolase/transaldolase/glucose-6-phosphate isomerase
MVTGPRLAELVAEGIRGVTSNPSIFEKAIGGSDLYDEQLSRSAMADAQSAFDELAIADIKDAADILMGVYIDSNGDDGYVSLEVSPTLADDSPGTIADARRLWAEVDRPNLMVKVPATPAGIPAIEELTGEGININATLMFSLADYEAVATAYVHGTLHAVHPIHLASVASFFVSRVDSATDAALDAIGTPEALAARGKAAIANAKLAYRRYQEIFEGAPFAEQVKKRIRPQRPLWASTSTKNPLYRDVMYIEDLIGPNTVNTAPPETIDAFLDHGVVKADSLLTGVDDAHALIASLPELGVDFDAITAQLQVDGVASFAAAYESLLATIATKLN